MTINTFSGIIYRSSRMFPSSLCETYDDVFHLGPSRYMRANGQSKAVSRAKVAHITTKPCASWSSKSGSSNKQYVLYYLKSYDYTQGFDRNIQHIMIRSSAGDPQYQAARVDCHTLNDMITAPPHSLLGWSGHLLMFEPMSYYILIKLLICSYLRLPRPIYTSPR